MWILNVNGQYQPTYINKYEKQNSIKTMNLSKTSPDSIKSSSSTDYWQNENKIMITVINILKIQ